MFDENWGIRVILIDKTTSRLNKARVDLPNSTELLPLSCCWNLVRSNKLLQYFVLILAQHLRSTHLSLFCSPCNATIHCVEAIICIPRELNVSECNSHHLVL